MSQSATHVCDGRDRAAKHGGCDGRINASREAGDENNRYVLIPDRLWMASQDLHINVGVTIRVMGDWEQERGRKFLRARSVVREP